MDWLINDDGCNFFYSFLQILHVARKCVKINTYCLCNEPDIVIDFGVG